MVSIVERLKLKTASEYTYLNQSDCLTIDGVDDAQKFRKLLVISLCFLFLPVLATGFVNSFCLSQSSNFVGIFRHCSNP